VGKIFIFITVGFLIVSGICPHDRFIWLLEVSWVLVGLGVLGYVHYKGIALSTPLKIALFLHSLILIYGGWYTYELTPLGNVLSTLFGFERNHYDRLGHFVQGLFPAVLYREVLIRANAVTGKWWREVFVFALAMAFSALFEILEFMSVLAFGSASDAYLGSQGDIWDAQWDMIYCGLGALVCIVFVSRLHCRMLEKLKPCTCRQESV
jgi:putative membrane protein